MSMSSSRPYMIRALYEWIVDNNCTPYVLVNALAETVAVPQEYVKDGQIVLNISPSAVMELLMNNDGLQFNGRFGGVPMDVYAPMSAIMGIYARENGQGMIFEGETPDNDPPSPPSEPKISKETSKPKSSDRPSLTVVK